MPITSGSRLGPYEILSPIGAGGMGEVYRARDTRLNRSVAIKVLPPELASDADRRARFERESQAIAALSHPHICTIYDVGRDNPSTGSGQAVDYIVMELLEGETLADRLGRAKARPLPMQDVLRYATEIADALDKAHRAGIVHRDLKPANIMLTKSGAKLLDFGLAKLKGPAAPISMTAIEQATTTGGPKTASGTILGTVHYMSPEQVEGREADARSDIWALGVVIYEMATGVRPFGGDSGASIIGAILKDVPPALSSRQPLSPPPLDHVIARCLAKDPDERWQHIGDVARELQWIRESPPAPPTVSYRGRTPSAFRSVAAAAALIGFAIGIGATFAARWQGSRESSAVMSFGVTSPPHTVFASSAATVSSPQLALSPDGKWLTFVAQGAGGDAMLWLRSLSGMNAEPLNGTEEASYPFWSPDSHSIGFFAQGKLKRIDVPTGAPQVVSDAVDPRGGAWSSDNVIVFGLNQTGLWRVPASGGKPSVLTSLMGQERGHRWPSFLPGGRRLLFLVRTDEYADCTIEVVSIDGSGRNRLFRSQFGATFVSGHLLSQANGVLTAQRFDPQKERVLGEATAVAKGVGGSSVNYSSFSASETGLLAFASDTSGEMQLAWFGRDGRLLSTLGSPRDHADVQLITGGRRALVTRTDMATSSANIWSVDVATGDAFPMTFDPATAGQPVVSPDGRQLAFRSSRQLPAPIFVRSTSGSGKDELLLQSSGTLFPSDWSPDGSSLLYYTPTDESGYDIFVLPLTGDRKPWAFVRTRGADLHPRFSPNGRFVAYSSAESGRHEIYVQPFPSADGRWQLSTAGGAEPRWRADGKELYFIAADRHIMAVPVTTDGSFEHKPAVPLFAARVSNFANPYRTTYAVSPDGQRFLISSVAENATAPSITVVINWTELLKK